MRDTSPAVDEFVTRVRALALGDDRYEQVGVGARTKLIIQMDQALGKSDKEWRVAVLQAITGLPMLKSSNHLTHHYTCVLIDATLEGKADGILQEICAIVKRNAESASPVSAASLIAFGKETTLPDMFQTAVGEW